MAKYKSLYDTHKHTRTTKQGHFLNFLGLHGSVPLAVLFANLNKTKSPKIAPHNVFEFFSPTQCIRSLSELKATWCSLIALTKYHFSGWPFSKTYATAVFWGNAYRMSMLESFGFQNEFWANRVVSSPSAQTKRGRREGAGKKKTSRQVATFYDLRWATCGAGGPSSATPSGTSGSGIYQVTPRHSQIAIMDMVSGSIACPASGRPLSSIFCSGSASANDYAILPQARANSVAEPPRGASNAHTFLTPMGNTQRAAPKGYTLTDMIASETWSPNLPGKQDLQQPLSKPCSSPISSKMTDNLSRAVCVPSTGLTFTSSNHRAPSFGWTWRFTQSTQTWLSPRNFSEKS